MKVGLFLHSPELAHALHVGFRSLHPPVSGGGDGAVHRKGSAWIHLVMVHFSPCAVSSDTCQCHPLASLRKVKAGRALMTGQPVCMEAGSISLAGVML